MNKDTIKQNGKKIISNRAAALAAVSLIALCAPNISMAQAAPENTNNENAQTSEVIIVTARKREETLQSTPLSISAFSAVTIENAGLDSVEDIAMLTPGFTFAPLFGGGAATPVIRGQSTTIGEPNVGFFLDGVYQSSRSLMDSIMGDDIARVEVVKGPQSALYGRNTFGGAVNIISRSPSNKYSARMAFEAGDSGYYGIRANANIPLIEDKLFARFGVNSRASDGYFTNSLTGGALDKRSSSVISASFEAVPSANLSMRLRVSNEETNDGDDPVVFTANNSRAATLTGPPFPTPFQMYTGLVPTPTRYAVTPGHNNKDVTTTSFSLNYEMDKMAFTAITGYNSLSLDTAIDNDYSAVRARYATSLSEFTEKSQEVRLASTGEGRLSWMVGAYVFRLESTTDLKDYWAEDALPIASNLGVPNGVRRQLLGGVNNLLVEQTDNMAAFAQLGFDITDKLSVNLETRWNREIKSVVATDRGQLTGTVSGVYTNKRTFEKVLPRLTVDYQMNQNILLYTTISEGYKAGGFNVATAAGAIADAERTYNPESAWNYEIGTKTSWYDGRLVFNLAGYKIDWRDQIVRALGATFATLNTNAGKTTVNGIEAEMRWHPMQGLDISGGLAYTDSTYDQYTFGTLALLGMSPVLDGKRLQYVSEWQNNLSVQYVMPISNDWSWFNRIDYSYRSDQSGVQTTDAVVPAATIVNLRTGVDYKNVSLRLFIDNATDEDAVATTAFTPNAAQHLAWAQGALGMGPLVGLEAFGGATVARSPRTVGMSISAKF